jgi:SAM-dependent methyltransferase
MDYSEILQKYNLDLSITHIKNDNNKIFDENGYAETYGELTKKGLEYLLDSLDTDNKIFYDLGSGTGNIIFLAAINYNLKKCIGIELSNSRYIHSKKLLENLTCDLLKSKIEFIHGDILLEDFKDADIIYISNGCYDKEISKKVGQKIKNTIKKDCTIFCSKELFLDTPHSIIPISQSWGENCLLYKYNFKPN